MNSFQIEFYLEWLTENPLPVTIAVDPPKKGRVPRHRA